MHICRFAATMIPVALLCAAPALAQQADAAAANPAQTVTNSNLTVNENHADCTVRCFQVKSIAPCDMVIIVKSEAVQARYQELETCLGNLLANSGLLRNE